MIRSPTSLGTCSLSGSYEADLERKLMDKMGGTLLAAFLKYNANSRTVHIYTHVHEQASEKLMVSPSPSIKKTWTVTYNDPESLTVCTHET